MASTFTGMRKDSKVQPLLRTVGGRLRDSPGPSLAKPEPADDDPPLSDDSDLDFGSLSTSTKANIKPSIFTQTTRGTSSTSKPDVPKTTRQTKKKDVKIYTRRGQGRPFKPDTGLGELELLEPESDAKPEGPSLKLEDDVWSDGWDSWSRGSKRKASDGGEQLGSHHAAAVGRRRPTVKAKYNRGRKNDSSDEEKPARNVKRNKKQARPTDSPPSPPKLGLRLHLDMPENEGCSSPRQRLDGVLSKSLFSDDETPMKKGLGGVVGKNLFSDDPTSKRKGLKGFLDKDLPSDDPTPKRRGLKGIVGKDVSSDDQTPKRKGLKDFGGLQDAQTQVSPPRKGLNLLLGPPSDTSDLDLDPATPGIFSQLPSRPRSRSASSSSVVELPARSPATLLSPSASRPACPMCNEEVDQSLFDEFQKRHPTSTWRQQEEFCTQHKRIKAKAVWKEKKYPSIDWKALDARVSRQSTFLRKILKGGKSHFRDVFAEKIKEAGRDRTVERRAAEEYMVPGYYGGRGMRVMSDKIVHDLSSTLQKSSLNDELVSAARGVGAYVQSVLVPELAVRLIMEDMDVGPVQARRIMEESMWLGELLNEELDDVVLGDDEEAEEERDDFGLPGEDDGDSSSDSSLSDMSLY